jgi:DNA-nicking Smr family endonuclease
LEIAVPTPIDPATDGPPDDPGTVHELPIEDALDLHAFAPREIPDAVREYLDRAREMGYHEVRLIHGKGIGFQRDRVRRVLESHPGVEAFADAPADRGHWGSTIVRLKPPEG